MRLRLFTAPTVALLAVAPMVGRPAPAAAQEFAVVVNSGNPVSSLTRQQVTDIFMRRLTDWPSGHGAIHPVDLPAVSPIRDAFSRAIHGRPGSAVASYWGQQLFSGRGVPPPQRPTERAVLEFVRGDALAIGYVSAGAVSPDVKVVRVSQ
jgi:ABC-type phosphate transport system substrate-binding protein